MDDRMTSLDGGAAPKPEPSERASLHEKITARLRDMIMEGELLPGARVPERVLCERFGISRTPLREALKVLASEGLLALNPNRGATVAKLTVEDVDEMFQVMGALEALSGELACAHITEEELAEIRALHYQMILHHTRHEQIGRASCGKECVSTCRSRWAPDHNKKKRKRTRHNSM